MLDRLNARSGVLTVWFLVVLPIWLAGCGDDDGKGPEMDIDAAAADAMMHADGEPRDDLPRLVGGWSNCQQLDCGGEQFGDGPDCGCQGWCFYADGRAAGGDSIREARRSGEEAPCTWSVATAEAASGSMVCEADGDRSELTWSLEDDSLVLRMRDGGCAMDGPCSLVLELDDTVCDVGR